MPEQQQKQEPYLLYGVEVGVIEVPEEPEDPRTQHLPQQEDEGGEVEDVDHAHQPVDEHGRAGCQVETILAILQRRVKHRLQGKRREAVSDLKFQDACTFVCA